jgi:hypothetical protein
VVGAERNSPLRRVVRRREEEEFETARGLVELFGSYYLRVSKKTSSRQLVNRGNPPFRTV